MGFSPLTYWVARQDNVSKLGLVQVLDVLNKEFPRTPIRSRKIRDLLKVKVHSTGQEKAGRLITLRRLGVEGFKYQGLR